MCLVVVWRSGRTCTWRMNFRYTCAPSSFFETIIFFVDEVDLIFSKAHLRCTNQASWHYREAHELLMISRYKFNNSKGLFAGDRIRRSHSTSVTLRVFQIEWHVLVEKWSRKSSRGKENDSGEMLECHAQRCDHPQWQQCHLI